MKGYEYVDTINFVISARRNNVEAVQKLIEEKPDLIEAVNDNLFYDLATRGHVEILKFLLGIYPAALHTDDNFSCRFLEAAVLSRNIKLVETVFKFRPNFADKIDNMSNHVLIDLLKEPATDNTQSDSILNIAKILLTLRPDLISTSTENNFNAFHYAVKNNHFKVVQHLLTVDPNLIDTYPDNELYEVADDTLACLFTVKPSLINSRPFMAAGTTYGGKLQALKKMLEVDPALINSHDSCGKNLLHGLVNKIIHSREMYFVDKHLTKIIDLLLRNNPALALSRNYGSGDMDSYGKTIWHIAKAKITDNFYSSNNNNFVRIDFPEWGSRRENSYYDDVTKSFILSGAKSLNSLLSESLSLPKEIKNIMYEFMFNSQVLSLSYIMTLAEKYLNQTDSQPRITEMSTQNEAPESVVAEEAAALVIHAPEDISQDAVVMHLGGEESEISQ